MIVSKRTTIRLTLYVTKGPNHSSYRRVILLTASPEHTLARDYFHMLFGNPLTGQFSANFVPFIKERAKLEGDSSLTEARR